MKKPPKVTLFETMMSEVFPDVKYTIIDCSTPKKKKRKK